MSASINTPIVRSRRRSLAAPARRNLFFEGLEDRRVFATGTVALSAATYSGTEGLNSGNITGTLVYTGETTTSAATAAVNLTAGTAVAADYTVDPITVNIPVGTATGTTINFNIPITNDTLLEGSESFSAAIGTVTPGAGDAITASGTTSANVTILDNETATLTFNGATINATEGDGTVNANLNLVITANGTASTGTVGNALTVNLLGNVGAGVDYTLPTVNIPVGTVSGAVPVSVSIADDTDVEATENFTLSIGTVTGGGAVNTSGSVMLVLADNDINVDLPSVAISGGVAVVVRGEVVTYHLVTTDSAADVAAGFTYNVDWGDGTTQTLDGGANFNIRHAYKTNGNFAVTVTATDQNADVSAEVSKSIQVKTFIVANGLLKIGGTAGVDNIVVRGTVNAGKVAATVNGSSLGVLSATRLRIYGNDGNDRISLVGGGNAKLAARAAILGGLGNDTISVAGNTRANIVVGGGGNDVLIGSKARDVLVGGAGRDTLRGTAGQDILVGAGTKLDANVAALDAVLAEWSGSGTLRARLNGLRGGVGFNLTTSSVVDDNVRDNLFGGGGLDFFVEGTADVDDAVVGELVLNL